MPPRLLGWLDRHLGIGHIAALLLPITLCQVLALGVSVDPIIPQAVFGCWVFYCVWLLVGLCSNQDIQSFRLIALGFSVGLVATGAYNLLRIPAIWMGVLPDVPVNLSRGVLGPYLPHWHLILVAYLSHFLMTGGPWGAVYFLIRSRLTLPGTFYGLLIGAAFLITPVSSGQFESAGLYSEPAFTSIIVLVFHAVYGAVLGMGFAHFYQRPEGEPKDERSVTSVVGWPHCRRTLMHPSSRGKGLLESE